MKIFVKRLTNDKYIVYERLGKQNTSAVVVDSFDDMTKTVNSLKSKNKTTDVSYELKTEDKSIQLVFKLHEEIVLDDDYMLVFMNGLNKYIAMHYPFVDIVIIPTDSDLEEVNCVNEENLDGEELRLAQDIIKDLCEKFSIEI